MRRNDYYRLLQDVRERGAWEAWLEFFLDGVAETADQAFDSARKIAELFKIDRDRIATAGGRSGSALRLHELMQTSPFVTASVAVERTKLTAPTINAAIEALRSLNIVEEVTGRKRGRVYVYRAYLDLLGDGAAPSDAQRR